MNHRLAPEKSTRVTRPQKPRLCSYSMCSRISVRPSERGTNECVCSQRAAGPDAWTSVKPRSDTFRCTAFHRRGSGPTQSVNSDTLPSASGSIECSCTIVGGGVSRFRAEVSRWKSRTAARGASTVNA